MSTFKTKQAMSTNTLLFLGSASFILLLGLIASVFIFKNFFLNEVIATYFDQHPLPYPVFHFFYSITLLANAETIIILLALMIPLSLMLKRCRLEVLFLTGEVGLSAFIESILK